MVKNKIYKYLSAEILKNFTIILLTFTIIAWTVRAVNFLDLMIEDGYSGVTYFQYSLLNISTIITRFIPLSYLLSLIISITKFERQQELLILWTAGLNKIKIANIFLFISFFLVFIQILLGLIINPLTLNKSRTLLRETEITQINSLIKSNDFSDAFKGLTFYVDKKNENNELINIFIRDNSGSLKASLTKNDNSNNTTIFAKKGVIVKNKLILFNGTIQTINKKNEIKNINFEKNELSTTEFSTRTIMQPKIQETSSLILFKCLINKKLEEILQNCSLNKSKKNAIEAMSRRVGMPLYIPLISTIASFLLIYKRERKYNFVKKYIVFSLAFIILILAEILLKYSGFSTANFMIYIFLPFFLFLILYYLLIKNMSTERIVR
ncbi:LptF/LptG family permease [Pelagibacteraceae bacterium]|nr:LptF/LptG family permease [Pelagibacteraceae bacterium]